MDKGEARSRPGGRSDRCGCHNGWSVPVAAAGRVAAVGVRAVAEGLEAGAVAPGAVAPIELDAAAAAGAVGGEGGLIAADFAMNATPGTGVHSFGDRPVAAAALVLRLQ